MPRPVIGEFRSAPNNAPRTETPSPVAPEPAAPSTASTPAPEVDAAEVLGVSEELTPAEKYRKRLEEAKVSIQEASTIYDAVIDKGFYEEYVQVGKNRAVFRSRLYEDQLRLQTALETIAPKLQVTQDELIARYNLAASLYEWKGKAIPHNSEADFENALTLIRRMPAPLVSMLTDRLARFDAKLLVVFSEGATDSF